MSTSGVFGRRNSVMFDAFANVPDATNPSTSSYKNRQVDIDEFNSRTMEGRLLHEYNMGKINSKLITGIV